MTMVCVMENDAARFRDHAAECRRLAQRALEKDKAVLMEIAARGLHAPQKRRANSSPRLEPNKTALR
jgi:hypothetical protein